MGRRFLRLIEDQLRHLHNQPAHGNRNVHLDHLVIAHLVAFWNPNVRGLRNIEDIFDDPRARKRFGLPRLPKSTVSDAQRVFDPTLLLPMLDSLRRKAGVQPHDVRLDAISRELVAVDGSFFSVAPRIAWALYNHPDKGNVRLHTQFNVFDALPDRITLTDGQAAEAQELRDGLRAGCFYVLDRGFQDYGLLKDILGAGSDFVVRLRKSARMKVIEERALTVADQAAGVPRDAIVQLSRRKNKTAELPPLRWVEVSYTNRRLETEIIILVTNRLDLPAWMIALIYQHRWQVELFFRWLKCIAHFQHFFSESREGMTLQVYVTMIALLLIAIETGAKPSKYDHALLSLAFSGFLTMDEALETAAKRRAERQRAAAWQRAYNARKKNVQ
jgi:IS4 transposase